MKSGEAPGSPESAVTLEGPAPGLRSCHKRGPQVLTWHLHSPACVLFCKRTNYGTRICQRSLLASAPFAGALGAEENHIESGVTAQAVYFSNPALPCQGPETSSAILEVLTSSPFCRPPTTISTVTASSPWSYTRRGSARAAAMGPSEGTRVRTATSPAQDLVHLMLGEETKHPALYVSRSWCTAGRPLVQTSPLHSCLA